MTQPIKNLWDAAMEVESFSFYFETIQTALDLWTELLDSDTPTSSDDPALCLDFAKRFPAYANLHRCFQAELTRQVEDLKQLSEDLYAAARKEKEQRKEGAPDAES